MRLRAKRFLSALLATLMIAGSTVLFSCRQTGTPEGGTTDGGGEEQTPENGLPGWLFNIDEKLAAQANPVGRNMSAAIGGDSASYPLGSRRRCHRTLHKKDQRRRVYRDAYKLPRRFHGYRHKSRQKRTSEDLAAHLLDD